MTDPQPNSGNELVEWVAILIAAAAAIMAWIRAGKSNTIAADSKINAKDAVSESRRANRLTEQANSIAGSSVAAAKASAEAANRSVEISERVEARQTERDDVRWHVAFDMDAGTWKAENIGLDTAHEAYACIQIKGQWLYSDHQGIEPGASLLIECEQHVQSYKAARAAQVARMSDSDEWEAPENYLRARHHVTWKTELGAWKSKDGFLQA